MGRTTTRWCVGLAAIALGLLTSASLAPAAHAAGLPVDPQASGSIALCGPTGQPITGGLLSTAPFIWTAIATTPAPAAYAKTGRNATLYAYQERTGVDPADWSGDQLTGTTAYSNAQYPTTQSTSKDLSLAQLIAEFPPQGAGYYELRMKYARLGYGDDPGDYAAATIQVTGKTWHVVAGGTVACSHGVGISNEVQAGVAPAAPSAAYIAAVSAASRVASSTSPSASAPSGGTASTSSGGTTNASTSTNQTATADAASSSSSSDSHTALIVTVAVVGALVVAGGGYGLGRRRR